MKNIFLILIAFSFIHCKKTENNREADLKGISPDNVVSRYCLKQEDSLKVEEIISEIQQAYRDKDSTMVKSYIIDQVIENYTYERVRSALEESLNSDETIYEFRKEDVSEDCGMFNVLYVTREIIKEDGEEYLMETGVSFLIGFRNGALKIINIGFAG